MQTNAEEYGPRDIIGYGPNPPDPQWPGGAKIAINLVRIGDSQTGVNTDVRCSTTRKAVSVSCHSRVTSVLSHRNTLPSMGTTRQKPSRASWVQA